MSLDTQPAAPHRLVIDTNVIISAALLAGSTSARLLRHSILNESIVLCEASYEELVTRLAKPKFDRYISQDMRRSFLHDLRAIAQWQPNPSATANAPRSRDADDNLFIDLALSSKAHLLISGDKDLTSMAESIAVYGLRITSPAQALELMLSR